MCQTANRPSDRYDDASMLEAAATTAYMHGQHVSQMSGIAVAHLHLPLGPFKQLRVLGEVTVGQGT
jgi:hypothetical protein